MNLNEAGALAAILGAAGRNAVVADTIPHHPATLTWGRAQRIGSDELTPAGYSITDVLDLYLYIKVDGLESEVGWAIRDLIPRYLSGWFIVDFDVAAYEHAAQTEPERQDQGWPSRPAVRVRPEDLLAIPGEENEDPPEGEEASPDAASLLPTGELMNPAHPEDDMFYDPGQVAYVVRETTGGQVRILTSFGGLADWELGSEHDIRHDQTWHPLGTWAVIGFRNYKDGLVLGEVPDRPLRHWVFK